MFTFERHPLPDSGHYSRLLEHCGGCAADQGPVTGDVLSGHCYNHCHCHYHCHDINCRPWVLFIVRSECDEQFEFKTTFVKTDNKMILLWKKIIKLSTEGKYFLTWAVVLWLVTVNLIMMCDDVTSMKSYNDEYLMTYRPLMQHGTAWSFPLEFSFLRRDSVMEQSPLRRKTTIPICLNSKEVGIK